MPETSRTTPAGLTIEERRSLVDRHVEKSVRVRQGREELAAWRERVRLYEPAEIDALAAASGFRVVERWPGLRGKQTDQGRHVAWVRSAV